MASSFEEVKARFGGTASKQPSTAPLSSRRIADKDELERERDKERERDLHLQKLDQDFHKLLDTDVPERTVAVANEKKTATDISLLEENISPRTKKNTIKSPAPIARDEDTISQYDDDDDDRASRAGAESSLWNNMQSRINNHRPSISRGPSTLSVATAASTDRRNSIMGRSAPSPSMKNSLSVESIRSSQAPPPKSARGTNKTLSRDAVKRHADAKNRMNARNRFSTDSSDVMAIRSAQQAPTVIMGGRRVPEDPKAFFSNIGAQLSRERQSNQNDRSPRDDERDRERPIRGGGGGGGAERAGGSPPIRPSKMPAHGPDDDIPREKQLQSTKQLESRNIQVDDDDDEDAAHNGKMHQTLDQDEMDIRLRRLQEEYDAEFAKRQALEIENTKLRLAHEELKSAKEVEKSLREDLNRMDLELKALRSQDAVRAAKITKLEQELINKQREYDRLSVEMSSKKGNTSELERKLADCNNVIGTLCEEIDTLKKTKLEGKFKDIEQQLTSLKSTQSQALEAAQAQIVAAAISAMQAAGIPMPKNAVKSNSTASDTDRRSTEVEMESELDDFFEKKRRSESSITASPRTSENPLTLSRTLSQSRNQAHTAKLEETASRLEEIEMQERIQAEVTKALMARRHRGEPSSGGCCSTRKSPEKKGLFACGSR